MSALSLSPALDDDGDTPSAAADGTCQHPSIVLLGSDLPSRSFSRRKGQRAPFNSFGNFHFFFKRIDVCCDGPTVWGPDHQLLQVNEVVNLYKSPFVC